MIHEGAVRILLILISLEGRHYQTIFGFILAGLIVQKLPFAEELMVLSPLDSATRITFRKEQFRLSPCYLPQGTIHDLQDPEIYVPITKRRVISTGRGSNGEILKVDMVDESGATVSETSP